MTYSSSLSMCCKCIPSASPMVSYLRPTRTELPRKVSENRKLKACAMTTNFDNTIGTFKNLLSWRFPRKTVFWDDVPLCPPMPPPPQKSKFHFCCCLAVFEKFVGRNISVICAGIFRNSDHLMSFKKVFHASHFCDSCWSC